MGSRALKAASRARLCISASGGRTLPPHLTCHWADIAGERLQQENGHFRRAARRLGPSQPPRRARVCGLVRPQRCTRPQHAVSGRGSTGRRDCGPRLSAGSETHLAVTQFDRCIPSSQHWCVMGSRSRAEGRQGPDQPEAACREGSDPRTEATREQPRPESTGRSINQPSNTAR